MRLQEGHIELARPQCSQNYWPTLTCLVALLLWGSIHPLDAQPVDVWRILALRVSFPTEEPDRETTSGDGTFDLRTFAEVRDSMDFPYDTPPHDKAYFEAHLQALANYYREMSQGRLEIEYDVYPQDPTASYSLTTPLIEYGNGRTRSEINERIIRLFQDGIAASDTSEGANLDFSQYRAFIVFHAGLGGESSQALNDVPSAYISPQDLDTYIDGPIPVDNGEFNVTNGLLLPEAISTNGRGGLNAAIARFFANQLRLPTLSDRQNDLPAVGRWSLLDSGDKIPFPANDLGLQGLNTDAQNASLVGFIPSGMLAWSRIRLGWITPLMVTHNDTVQIVAAHVRSDLPQAVQVPISATEYFLLENRISRLKERNRTPTIQFSRGTEGGVWLSIDDYDAFIPGSGILIWHIDDAVIQRSDSENQINSNPAYEIAFAQYRRGVSLEEADGLEDIGNVSASRVIQDGIISFSTIEGGAEDPYYVGNTTTFDPNTTPNTNSNLNYPSGITIEVLSPPGDTMAVAIRFARFQKIWPITGLTADSRHAPRVVDLNGDGTKEIIRAQNQAVAFGTSAWSIDGTPVDEPRFTATSPPAIGNLTSTAPSEFIFANENIPFLWRNGQIQSSNSPSIRPAPFSASPLIAPFPFDIPTDIWGRSDGTVEWGHFSGTPGSVSLNDPITGFTFGRLDRDANNELIALTNAGQLFLVGGPDQALLLATFINPVVGNPAMADLDRDGDDELVVVTSDGVLSILDREGQVVRTDPVPGGATSAPVLGDLDNDGYIEALFGGRNNLWVIRFNGILQTNAPIAFPLKDQAGPILASPLLADLDGDGTLEILVGTPGGLLYGLDASGKPLPGFPLQAPGPITTSPLLDDLDGDGTLELVFFTAAGSIHLHHLENIDPTYTGNRVVWGQLGGNPANTGHLLQPPQATPTALPLDELLPKKRVYCYPNPIRQATARIRFFLGEPAEVHVVIVNALGEEVARLSHTTAIPGTDNEIIWDTSDYQSGLYICRVEAIASNRSEVQFIKTAVIK